MQLWEVVHKTSLDHALGDQCVNLIGLCTLKGKDCTGIDFMCVTIIDSATSWFEVVELFMTALNQPDIPSMGKKVKKGRTHMKRF